MNSQKNRGVKIITRKRYSEYEKNRKRNKRLGVRCTEEERELILKNAQTAKMNINEYMIKSALKEKIVIYDIKPILDMNIAINSIGNNINQIAHKINIYNAVQLDDMNFIKKQLGDLKNDYKKFLKKINMLI